MLNCILNETYVSEGAIEMALTPLDIHNKVFSRGFRGYDEDEVNEFLEQVMRDYEAVIEENKKLKLQLEDREQQVTHFNTIENTLQQSIVIAQEAADDVRRNAQQESKIIIKEAEKNADRIINDALSKSREITLEIDDLKKQSKVFRNRFRLLIEAQLELLQSDGWDELMNYDIEAKLNKIHPKEEQSYKEEPSYVEPMYEEEELYEEPYEELEKMESSYDEPTPVEEESYTSDEPLSRRRRSKK